MTDITSGTRYIAVASFSKKTEQEWIDAGLEPRPPIYQDYALLKVLYMLRMTTKTKKRIPVKVFKYEDPLVPLDFSSLQDSDIIFIVGHGDQHGLYALGPNGKTNVPRLIEVFTKDGNLKKKRKDKEIVILFLSCRAGLGLHKSFARKLFNEIGTDATVGGPQGFTFGSIRTVYLAENEVLIRGIPWYMEYPKSITKDEAEKQTSAREGKTITYDGKKAEIEAFTQEKTDLETEMKAIVAKLKSTEVNDALDELESKFKSQWLAVIRSQFELYALAKKRSKLEFDMWYDNITDGYLWTSGKRTTDQEANAVLTGVLIPTDDGLTSVK